MNQLVRQTRIVTRAVALLAIATASQAAAPEWELAWEDSFDSLDDSVWQRVHSTQPTNRSLHAYLPEQVTVEAGRLVITSTAEPYKGLAYRSGQVISRSEQRLGRWEVRAKMPESRGMWPAIWLLPDAEKHRWPSGGEIDLLENRGDQPRLTSSAFHFGTNPPYRHEFANQEQRTAIRGGLVNYHDSFHTYAVDWTERYVRFYVDGVNHFTVFDSDVERFLSRRTKPMKLMINNAIGGTFLPDPDGTTVLPQRMEIDWVRVYALRGEDGEAAFTNGEFEESLAGWSLFGADTTRTQNAQISGEAVRRGEGALKLVGASEGGDRYSGVTQGITVEAGQRVAASASAFVRSGEPLAGTANRLLMKIEFYDAFGSKYGDGMLGEFEKTLADRRVAADVWSPHRLEAIAPKGAVEARLAFVFDQPVDEGGAVFIDSVSFSASPQ